MLYNFISSFFGMQTGVFNLDSLLIRGLFAFIFAFIFSIVGLKILIDLLNRHKMFQPIRSSGPESHITTKQKTPTMGGIVLSIAILSAGILFCDMDSPYVVAVLTISMLFGLIGLIDDIIKVFYRNTMGFKGSIKLILQIVICGLVIMWLTDSGSPIAEDSRIFIPFFKIFLPLGVLYIPFIMAVIVGSSNAVNITDGLDGLAIVPIVLCCSALGILAISSGFGQEVKYIATLNMDNPSELAVICVAAIGSGMAFLLFNRYPAKIFMGDCGSLMYGSLLGSIAVMLKQEIFYGIIALLFVMEAMSSIIQVTSYKLRNKRIFLMAPLHHHFEKLGWPERKIVLVSWTFTFICIVVAFIGVINF